MHIVVVNNDNFVATHPRTIVQYTIKCETITKIYSVRSLNTLIYVHNVRISKQIFFRDSVRKPRYHCISISKPN